VGGRLRLSTLAALLTGRHEFLRSRPYTCRLSAPEVDPTYPPLECILGGVRLTDAPATPKGNRRNQKFLATSRRSPTTRAVWVPAEATSARAHRRGRGRLADVTLARPPGPAPPRAVTAGPQGRGTPPWPSPWIATSTLPARRRPHSPHPSMPRSAVRSTPSSGAPNKQRGGPMCPPLSCPDPDLAKIWPRPS
jgi:hypothetical protein